LPKVKYLPVVVQLSPDLSTYLRSNLVSLRKSLFCENHRALSWCIRSYLQLPGYDRKQPWQCHKPHELYVSMLKTRWPGRSPGSSIPLREAMPRQNTGKPDCQGSPWIVKNDAVRSAP